MFGQSRVFQILMVAIIISFLWALYAGIAMPSFRKGQQSVCTRNLRQLSLAVQMYASDNDSILPPFPRRSDDAWPQVLRHYALSEKSKHFDPDLVDVATVKPFICPTRAEKGYGYGLNYYIAEQLIDSDCDPTKVIMFAEANGVTDDRWWVNDSTLTARRAWYQPRVQKLPLLSVHPSGVVAFLDGSVRAMKTKDISAENWLMY